MNNTQNNAVLTEKENEYLLCDTPCISVFSVILRTVFGVVLALLSSFIAPSAESDIPMRGYFSKTFSKSKYTRYKKAVIRKKNGTGKKRDDKTLKKLNCEDFALDNRPNNNDKYNEQIMDIYQQHYLSDSDNLHHDRNDKK